MTSITDRKTLNRFDRWAKRVADLMARNPRSLRDDATVREAVSFLAKHETSAAPVINEAGRPIGILSLSDLVSAIREHRIEEKTFFELPVSRLMTPFVLFVNAETPLHAVVSDLLDYKIRQIYVTDDDGVLVGALNRGDLLTDLRQEADEASGVRPYGGRLKAFAAAAETPHRAYEGDTDRDSSPVETVRPGRRPSGPDEVRTGVRIAETVARGVAVASPVDAGNVRRRTRPHVGTPATELPGGSGRAPAPTSPEQSRRHTSEKSGGGADVENLTEPATAEERPRRLAASADAPPAPGKTKRI